MDSERWPAAEGGATDGLATAEFDDGRGVVYDPSSPTAWLLFDPP
ncbi:hypothetical protein [Halosegnis sp.]